MSCCFFKAVVTDEGGRIVAVHPDTQIVERMVACVTAGFRAPGVREAFGKTTLAVITSAPTEVTSGGGDESSVTGGDCVEPGAGLGTGAVLPSPVTGATAEHPARIKSTAAAGFALDRGEDRMPDRILHAGSSW